MTDDIVTRLTLSEDHSPSECWGCGEWGCRNSEGETVPCFCDYDNSCSHDNNCDCDCHEWYGIVIDAKAEIERLRDEVKHLEMLLVFETCEFCSPVGPYVCSEHQFRYDQNKMVRDGDR